MSNHRAKMLQSFGLSMPQRKLIGEMIADLPQEYGEAVVDLFITQYIEGEIRQDADDNLPRKRPHTHAWTSAKFAMYDACELYTRGKQKCIVCDHYQGTTCTSWKKDPPMDFIYKANKCKRWLMSIIPWQYDLVRDPSITEAIVKKLRLDGGLL